MLYSAHAMLAAFAKMSQLELTEDESRELATAINRVTELYEISLDEKARAWLNLSLVGVEVCGTRISTVMIERQKKPAAPEMLAPV